MWEHVGRLEDSVGVPGDRLGIRMVSRWIIRDILGLRRGILGG